MNLIQCMNRICFTFSYVNSLISCYALHINSFEHVQIEKHILLSDDFRNMYIIIHKNNSASVFFSSWIQIPTLFSKHKSSYQDRYTAMYLINYIVYKSN